MKKIGELTYLIDLYDLSYPYRTGSYVILSDEITIIETSASPSHEYLLNGLNELNIPLEKVKNLIVTHIHLDHSGGAGLLMEKCPNATLYVHPKGAPHLENPTKLIASAKQVYGEDFDRLFDPILPVDQSKIYSVQNGEELMIGKNHKLSFLYTPGHANHHISIFDHNSKYMYTGDTIGIYYPQLESEIGAFVLPSTSPNQFSYDLMIESLNLIKSYKPDAICFGHFGLSNQTQYIYETIPSYLDFFMNKTSTIIEQHPHLTFYEKSTYLSNALFEEIKQELISKNIQADHPVFNIMKLDIEVSAMGLILSVEKNKKHSN